MYYFSKFVAQFESVGGGTSTLVEKYVYFYKKEGEDQHQVWDLFLRFHPKWSKFGTIVSLGEGPKTG